MRKKVLGLVMAAFAVSSIGAFAQTETQACQTPCEQSAKECHKEKKDNKCDRKDGKKCNRKDVRKGEGFNPFEGIQLTDEQQQQIKQLKEERKVKREADKKARKEGKSQERKQFNEDLSKILTPEQYAQYQANCEKMKVRKGELKGKVKKDRDHKKAEFKKREVKKDK